MPRRNSSFTSSARFGLSNATVLFGTSIDCRSGHSDGCREPGSGNSNLEDYSMFRTHRFVASLILGAALLAPVSILAAANPQDVSVRVYDRNHKDYHNWDDNENRAWTLYLTNNHAKYHEYSKANKREQSNYWNWRHSHPDQR
jgi:hypothetical protein